MRIDQIPYGHENAVRRPQNASEDRKLREDIEMANQTGDCIINVGEGYYRPIPGDSIDDKELNEYLAKERSRKRSIRKKRHAMMAAYSRREQDGICIEDTGETGEPE